MDHRSPVARRFLTGLGFGLILAGMLVAAAGATPQDKVTICHRTNSVKNPYVQQTVNVNSIVVPNGTPTGHGLHTGPLYPQPIGVTSFRRSPTRTTAAARPSTTG